MSALDAERRGEPVAAAEDGAPPRASGRRRGGCAVAALVVALAVAGHWAYWYRARPHEMAPADSQLLRQGPDLAVRFWLPYPHQNLGALGGAVGRPREVLAAAARLAGLPEPPIPRLGPFGTPPARELRVSASRDGRFVDAAIRLYPVAAALTRISGMLARNPWLAGGEVRLSGEPATVSWDGLTWRLRAGVVALAGPDGDGARDETSRDAIPALALVQLAEAVPPLPAGSYPLRREGGDVVLRLGEARQRAADEGLPAGVILIWVERRPEHAEALLLMEADREGLLANLPAAAAWASPGGAMQALPGGSILRHLTDVRPAPYAGGELAATERSAAARAEEISGVWLPMATGRTTPPLALGGWLAIDPAAQQAERLHGLLKEIPILGAAEAQRWGDVATVLRAAHGYRTLSLWLAADGSSGELRLRR